MTGQSTPWRREATSDSQSTFTAPRIMKNRDFLLLWSGNAATHIGLKGVMLAYPLLALVLTNSPVSASLVTFALQLPGLIFQVPSGVVADYWDRRRVLLICQRAGLTATVLATIAATVQPPGLTYLLAVAAFAEGTAYVFFNTSELGLIRDIVPEPDRAAAFAFLEAEEPIANMGGRVFGAAVFGIARSLPFLANAASYLYCLWTLAKIRQQAPAKPETKARRPAQIWGWDNVLAGVRELWADPFVRGSTLVGGMANGIWQIVILMITLKVTDGGYSTWVIGAVLSTTGLGGLLGATRAPRIAERYSPKIVLVAGVWAWLAVCAAMAATSNPLLLGICFSGVGGAGTILGVSLTLHRTRVFPDDHVGRIFGATKFISHGGTAIGALLAGGLLKSFGATTTGWIATGCLIAIAAYARRLPDPWTPAPDPVSTVTSPPVNWIEQLSRKSPEGR
ncbi:MFS family permease [Nocardia sp. GP40]|uniref:MFS transporter n=2 Tax=unclassified Nocardia TaxID=2637762 RepID=UPI003D20E358